MQGKRSFIMIHDLINPRTGKTYKQENLEVTHHIPIGSLVEVRFSQWFGGGACWVIHARLWVIGHDRDCDGTPLYSLSHWNDPIFGSQHDCFHGFSEERLKVIPLTQNVVSGEDALELEDE